MGARERMRLVGVLVLTTAGALLVTGVSASAATKTKVFSSGDIDMAIPGLDIATSKQQVRPRGRIKDVNVSVRISHPFVGDLFLLVTDPKGNPVNLSAANGGDGDDYGSESTDCTGAFFTFFDDSAATAITAGTPPFNGPHAPEGSLLDLKGGKTKGAWRLHVIDGDGVTGGTLHCWELQIKYKKL